MLVLDLTRQEGTGGFELAELLHLELTRLEGNGALALAELSSLHHLGFRAGRFVTGGLSC